jgi:transcriptional regulator
MHPNKTFSWDDQAELLAFIADISFCTIFVGEGGDGGQMVHAPVVVHAPDRLRFHIARSNRAAPHLEGASALLSCLGPDVYVSPDWYGTPDQVPTWNYVSVEARGRLRRLSEDELIAQIDALSAAHEERLLPKPPWTRHKMTPGRFEAMAKAIIGFELAIDDLRGTRKLGQNKKPGERAGAIAGLAAAGQEAFASLMEAHSPPASPGAKPKSSPPVGEEV